MGCGRVFSVPGESFLAALDGLYDHGIANIVCRQEGGAAMMAEATWQADRAARHGLCHPRARRDECQPPACISPGRIRRR
jgi:hypothetical protein